MDQSSEESSDYPIYTPPPLTRSREPSTSLPPLHHHHQAVTIPPLLSASTSSPRQRSSSDDEEELEEDESLTSSSSSSESEDDHLLLTQAQQRRQSLGGLNLQFNRTLPSSSHHRRDRSSTITTSATTPPPLHAFSFNNPPFSRPPSAVTVPSRPGTTAPPTPFIPQPPRRNSSVNNHSPTRQRTLTKRTAGTLLPPVPQSSAPEVEQVFGAGAGGVSPPLQAWASPPSSASLGDEDFSPNYASRVNGGVGGGGGVPGKRTSVVYEDAVITGHKSDAKGKGKATVEFPSSSSTSTSSKPDPLDPLSSLRTSYKQPSVSLSLSPPPPPPPPIIPPTTSKHKPPPLPFPSSASTSSSTSLSSQPSPSNATSAAEPLSLQQILQTVDLTAALKLVQTLQTAPPQPPPVPQSLSAVPAIVTSSPSPTPNSSTFPPSTNHAHFAPNPTSTSTSNPTTSSTLSPTIGSPQLREAEVPTADSTRRRSISLNFGGIRSRKDSIGGSTLSTGGRSFSAGGGLASLANGGSGGTGLKVVDERASMSGAGRGFEEQISKVHLTLSPATLRRTQNCVKYLSMRYTPIFSALSPPPPVTASPSSPPPTACTSTRPSIPNLLQVSRWRDSLESEERLKRRALVSLSTTSEGTRKFSGGKKDEEVLSDKSSISRGYTGGGRASGLSLSSVGGVGKSATYGYGARRNRFPKAWEVYPDELVAYLADMEKRKKDGDRHSLMMSLGGNYQNGKVRRNSVEVEGRGRFSFDSVASSRSTQRKRNDLDSSTNTRNSDSSTNLWENQRVPPPISLSTNSTLGSPINSSNHKKTLSTTSLVSNPSPVPSTHSKFSNSNGKRRGSADIPPASPPPLQSSTISSTPLPSPSTSLRRSGSLGHSPPSNSTSTSTSGQAGLKSPFSSWTRLGAIASSSTSNIPRSDKDREEGGAGSLSKVFGAGTQSGGKREEGHMSEPTSSPNGRYSGVATFPFGYSGTVTSSGGGSTKAVKDRGSGLGLGKRIDKIRGRNLLSDLEGDGSRRLGEDGEFVTARESGEVEMTLKRPNHGRVLSADYLGSSPGSGASSKVNVNKFSGGTGEGYKSSGGEEGGGGSSRRRVAVRGSRIWAAAWSGLKGSSLDTSLEGGDLEKVLSLRRDMPVQRRWRRLGEEDSDDEEIKVPREVLDLNAEEFTKLTQVLRQLKTELSHADTLLPKIPTLLNGYLSSFDENTQTISLDYSFPLPSSHPRLPASVVAELAQAKVREQSYSDSESDSDSLVSSPGDISESDDEGDGGSGGRRALDLAGTGNGSVRFKSTSISRSRSGHRQPQRSSSGHSRRRTDSIGAARPVTIGRMRAQTVAAPARARPLLRAEPVEKRDPIVVLERAVEELQRMTEAVEDERKRYGKEQDGLFVEIGNVMMSVDKVQKIIADEHEKTLNDVTTHLKHLQSSIRRPRPEVDALWAALSYVLTTLFFFSRMGLALFRIFRIIFSIPLYIIRGFFTGTWSLDEISF